MTRASGEKFDSLLQPISNMGRNRIHPPRVRFASAHRRRHLTRLALIASWLVLGTACPRADKEQTPAPTLQAGSERETSAATEISSKAKPATRADACPSWAQLDRASLAPLPHSPYAPILEQVWETVRTRHYDPTLRCLDWPALRKHFGQELAHAPNREAAYAAINAMLDRLGQSHLHAMSPARENEEVAHATGPATLALPLVWIGDELVVRAPRPGEKRASVAKGSRIVAIDGVKLDTLVDRKKMIEPIARSTALAPFLTCPVDLSRRVTYRSVSGRQESKMVKCRVAAGDRLDMGHLQSMVAEVHAEMLDRQHGIGYLRFSLWLLPMVASIHQELDRLQHSGLKALILDLRGNHGGVATMPIPIARRFLRHGGSLGHLQMRGFSQDLVVRANDDAFDGPLYLLIDRESASTSELFALGMRELGRATLVGSSPSAGMALPSLIEALPDGGLLQHVVGDYRSTSGKIAEGDGLAPDVLVPENPEAIAKHGDVVLARAIALAKDQVQSSQRGEPDRR
jgi:carboxyl-terminal processing protease